MEKKKILTILVFVLAPVLASNAYGKISLTVNNQNVSSITLQVDQSCTVEVVSSDSTPYEAYVGFYRAPIIGDFSLLEIKPEAGKGAEVLKYSTPDFRGYNVITGSGITPPSTGVHFVLQFEAREVGETDVTLYDETLKTKLDSLHITVLPAAMGTVFTYQGRLLHENNPTDGPYDFEFKLYDSPVGGNQLASTIDINDLDVIDGYFTVELDFNDPNVFNGDACWLDIAVRPGDSNSFTSLSPRQQLTPTPYAIYAENAGNDNDWMISGDNMYSIPSGRVGIGTTSPSSKLHVEDDTTGDVQITIHNQDNSGSERLLFGTSTATDAGMLVYGSANAATPGKWRFFNNKTSGHFDWVTGASVKMTLADNGYLGIGTTNPAYRLHIYETDPGTDLHPMIDNDYRHAGLIIDCAANYDASVLFRENGANKFMIQSDGTTDYGLGIYEYGGPGFTTVWKNGRVGIGTTFPSSKLHIEDDTTNDVKVTINNQNNTGSERLYFGTDAGIIAWGSGNTTYPGKWRFFNNRTSGNYDWITSGSIKMTLANNGNLGIGTTSPGAGLHLQGTDFPSSFMYLQSNTGEDTGFRLYEGTSVKWHIFNESAAGGLSIRNSAYSSVLFIEQSTREVGIGTTSPQAKLDVAGRTRTQVLEITGGSDLSEQFEIKTEQHKVEPGMVVCIDQASCGNLVVSQKAYDRTVAGIVSGAGGVKPGMMMGQKGTMADGEHPVALTGRVYCRADASKGPITPGDLLTTSDVAGHAMKVNDYERAQGAILGKAMSSLNDGKGLVLVLVSLQ
ncbi:MAG: hypothetical protein OEW48_16690 [Phycisphaerae bacterium]|nr:hypothetical protein [Phycisphaerae bacterium]